MNIDVNKSLTEMVIDKLEWLAFSGPYENREHSRVMAEQLKSILSEKNALMSKENYNLDDDKQLGRLVNIENDLIQRARVLSYGDYVINVMNSKGE
jgi:hypothetical protein